MTICLDEFSYLKKIQIDCIVFISIPVCSKSLMITLHSLGALCWDIFNVLVQLIQLISWHLFETFNNVAEMQFEGMISSKTQVYDFIQSLFINIAADS